MGWDDICAQCGKPFGSNEHNAGLPKFHAFRRKTMEIEYAMGLTKVEAEWLLEVLADVDYKHRLQMNQLLSDRIQSRVGRVIEMANANKADEDHD